MGAVGVSHPYPRITLYVVLEPQTPRFHHKSKYTRTHTRTPLHQVEALRFLGAHPNGTFAPPSIAPATKNPCTVRDEENLGGTVERLLFTGESSAVTALSDEQNRRRRKKGRLSGRISPAWASS